MSKSKSEKSAKAKIHVFIVDDHQMLRQGIKAMINLEADMVVSGEAASTFEALKQIESKPPGEMPDVALVDLSLKDSSGLDLIKDLQIRCPELRVIVLSMQDESFYAERVLHAGAKGFINKELSTAKIIEGIRLVMTGKLCISDRVAERIISKSMNNPVRRTMPSPEALSDRELEVLELIGHGFASGEIAEKLHLSVKTIESHREHIKQKLELRNAPQLVKYAFHWVHHKQPLGMGEPAASNSL